MLYRLVPFYAAPSVQWIQSDFVRCENEEGLKSRLATLQSQSVDYLIAGKNMSNRNWCVNQILRRMRNDAVFVDVQQGFEYGWLFRLPDVAAALAK